MRFSKLIALALTVVGLIIWGSNVACGSPVLVKLELANELDYQKANQLNVAVYHKFPTETGQPHLVIAEFEKSNLAALDNAGLPYQVVDEDPWSESYYLISESQRTESVSLSEYGEILVSTGKSYFMKISDESARSLAAKGYYIVKVFRRPLPLKYKPTTESSPKGHSYYPEIDSLLSLISQDSLYAWTLRLQNFQTRYSYSDSIIRARNWIFNQFLSFDIDSLWLHYYYDDSPQWNVVATVVGTARPDKVIVVGGHYDSVVYGAGTNPYIWAPGADDNGTGTVATLEMARIIARNPLPVTVMFVPFAQEEQGLIGSWYFAHWLYYHYADVHLMINSDMIAHSVDSYQDVIIYGASSAMDFISTMMDMANTYTYLHPSYGGQSSGSDHYSFYQWGYDAVFAAEGDFFYNGWHENYDVVDSLDFSYMKEVVKMCLATLYTEARSIGYIVGDPTWNGSIDAGDVVFLLSYLFRSGPAPDPLETGDVTCDGQVNAEDVVFLIDYLFRGGNPPPSSC
ncbi:MAG: M20/M25/M40 family metallo-hydrolase [candidate division Zixibacteria bacterium]|nr:M20/M25/M40 family metallo-hydrolase [candidate division Zixibacteria bacterium]